MARGSQSGGEAFARKLNALMEQSGFSQAYLAEKLGVWDSLVSRWRKGGGISVENVRKIADLFAVDRGDLERLAGYSDKPLSSEETTRTEIELEQQMWRARFDSVMEKKVPRRAWETYMAACEALADLLHISSPGELSTPAQRRLSDATAESGDSDPGGDTRDLSLRYRRGRSTQQIVERLMPAGV